MAEPFRIRKLTVENFKCFDKLDLDFPPPELPGDPDVFVLGSKNGLGKTSVLEAIALPFCSRLLEEEPSWRERLGQSFIRAGQPFAEVRHQYLDQRTSRVKLKKKESHYTYLISAIPPVEPPPYVPSLGPQLLGHSEDPLLIPPLLYFHSYRQVRQGTVELGALTKDESVSRFKSAVLVAVFAKAGGLEVRALDSPQEALNKANEILLTYAGGTVEKASLVGNAIDLPIVPVDGSPSISFDGLSSGQKEIISTLYLIWHFTKNRPSIVLIDEPELHLNAEWQAGFVRTLYALAPDNQYILATHSEFIFGSVRAERRILLEPEPARVS